MEAILKINNEEIPVELTLGQVEQITKASTHYTDITSFEKACVYNGTDAVEFEKKYGCLPRHIYAQLKLEEIVKAINGGEVQNYSDADEWKYYPWFNSVGSASGFLFRGFDCGRSASYVGSRLVYPTRDIAKYVASQHIELYRDLMVIE